MASALRIPVASLEAGERELDEEAARYAVRVHRLRAGDRVVLFDPHARTEGEAEIASVRREVVRVRVGAVRAAALVARRAVELLQGVAKGEKMDAVVRDATELGVTAIVPASTRRSVAERANDKVVARWERVAIEAARQCGRGDVPSITAPRPLVEVAPSILADARFVLAPNAPASLGDLVRKAVAADVAASFAIAIGPEGGFDEDELAHLERVGFVRARLGRFVLRTETAATAALAIVADLDAG